MHFSPVSFVYTQDNEVTTMSIQNLDDFPNTISSLPDKPNLSGTQMKAKLEADCAELWAKVKEIIPELNSKQAALTLLTALTSAATDDSVPTSKAVYDAIADAAFGGVVLPLSVANGGTGATSATAALENLGIYTGTEDPDTVKDNLATGDIYIWFAE